VVRFADMGRPRFKDLDLQTDPNLWRALRDGGLGVTGLSAAFRPHQPPSHKPSRYGGRQMSANRTTPTHLDGAETYAEFDCHEEWPSHATLLIATVAWLRISSRVSVRLGMDEELRRRRAWRTLRRRLVGPTSFRQLDKTGCFSQQQLQGWTEYGPRVCVDKGRARCRKDVGSTSLRQPLTPPTTAGKPQFKARARV
jgi:hypothetical protein